MTKCNKRSKIRTNTDASTRDTVGDRCEPGKLGLVDGEMRGRGTEETLLVQDCLGSRRREGLGLNGAGF